MSRPKKPLCERSGQDREESRSDGHDHGRFGETFPLSPVVTFAMARRHRPRSYGVIQRLFEVEPSSPLAARGTRARGREGAETRGMKNEAALRFVDSEQGTGGGLPSPSVDSY